jgi:hypothetical protein
MKTKPSQNTVTIVARDSRPGVKSKSFSLYDTDPETVIAKLREFCESQANNDRDSEAGTDADKDIAASAAPATINRK